MNIGKLFGKEELKFSKDYSANLKVYQEAKRVVNAANSNQQTLNWHTFSKDQTEQVYNDKKAIEEMTFEEIYQTTKSQQIDIEAEDEAKETYKIECQLEQDKLLIEKHLPAYLKAIENTKLKIFNELENRKNVLEFMKEKSIGMTDSNYFKYEEEENFQNIRDLHKFYQKFTFLAERACYPNKKITRRLDISDYFESSHKSKILHMKNTKKLELERLQREKAQKNENDSAQKGFQFVIDFQNSSEKPKNESGFIPAEHINKLEFEREKVLLEMDKRADQTNQLRKKLDFEEYKLEDQINERDGQSLNQMQVKDDEQLNHLKLKPEECQASNSNIKHQKASVETKKPESGKPKNKKISQANLPKSPLPANVVQASQILKKSPQIKKRESTSKIQAKSTPRPSRLKARRQEEEEELSDNDNEIKEEKMETEVISDAEQVSEGEIDLPPMLKNADSSRYENLIYNAKKKKLYIAIKDFRHSDKNYFTLKQGDLVCSVLTLKGWYLVYQEDNPKKFGFCPGNYLNLIN